MNFWLGVHHAHWLATADVPLFVSHRTLATRRTFPRAAAPWVLDSGAFTELHLHGHHQTTGRAYAAAVHRYADEIGQLTWCAPQDFMCEPFMLERTKGTVLQHQCWTVANYLELAARLDGRWVIPVLQGWDVADYHACADRYERAGIDLAATPLVGVGSICRRQDSHTITTIVSSLASRGLHLHAFGISGRGLARYAHHLTSADSMAWSQLARRQTGPMLPGCTHRRCGNCLPWALIWRRRTITAASLHQLELFA